MLKIIKKAWLKLFPPKIERPWSPTSQEIYKGFIDSKKSSDAAPRS